MHFLDVFCVYVLITLFFSYIYAQMRLQNKLKLASILFILVSFVCAAQGIDNPPPPMPPPPPGLPIDGSVLLVLVLGLIYGVYFRIKVSKQKES